MEYSLGDERLTEDPTTSNVELKYTGGDGGSMSVPMMIFAIVLVLVLMIVAIILFGPKDAAPLPPSIASAANVLTASAGKTVEQSGQSSLQQSGSAVQATVHA